MSTLKDHVRQFCSKYALRLNTDLGQHFLVHQDVLGQIIEAATITDNDHIVEIGPGIGVLTAELLKKAQKVTAIELDERMIPLLEQYVEDALSTINYPLSVIQGNALQTPMPEEPYKIVANIPYHITSPLLRHVFLESNTPPKSLTLLMQKEVVDTICSKESAGMLTVIVGMFGIAKKICNVPPRSFIPPPKVNSAVLHIDCFDTPLVDAETLNEVIKLTKIGFSMRRKMLRNSFGFDGGLNLLSAVNIDETRRPQTLSVEEWIALAQARMQAR